MLEGIFSFIIFTIVGFWILGIVGRFLLKRWVAKKQREFQQQFGGDGSSFQGGFGNNSGFGGTGRAFYGNANFGGRGAKQQNDTQQHKEGEVFLTDTTPTSDKKVNTQVGEYIDFEDIK